MSSRSTRSEERRVGKECRSRWWAYQAEDGIRDGRVTGVQTCALPIFKVPTGSVTKGPEQVRGILNSNSTISKDLSLFNSANGGSSVVYGNLLTLPLGNSFLYVEPLYEIGRASCRERV